MLTSKRIRGGAESERVGATLRGGLTDLQVHAGAAVVRVEVGEAITVREASAKLRHETGRAGLFLRGVTVRTVKPKWNTPSPCSSRN